MPDELAKKEPAGERAGQDRAVIGKGLNRQIHDSPFSLRLVRMVMPPILVKSIRRYARACPDLPGGLGGLGRRFHAACRGEAIAGRSVSRGVIFAPVSPQGRSGRGGRRPIDLAASGPADLGQTGAACHACDENARFGVAGGFFESRDTPIIRR